MFFINECKKINTNLELNDHETMIKELFIVSELKNLRVLRQALLDIHRLTKIFDEEFVKHKNYPIFIKNLIAYFIIVFY